MSENRVIGRHNALPWKMPADHEYFKQITEGHPFIMGRMSYLSKDRFLSTTRSVILTHHTDEPMLPNCERAESLGEALSMLGNDERIFIIGGGSVYRQSLSIASHIYLTVIHTQIEGDTYFPELDTGLWKIVKQSHHRKDRRNPFDYSFIEYVRSGYTYS